MEKKERGEPPRGIRLPGKADTCKNTPQFFINFTQECTTTHPLPNRFQYTFLYLYPRFSVNLIFGAEAAEEEGVPGGLSSSIDITGGLVAKGDGTALGNPKDDRLPLPPAFGGPRLKPKLVNPGAVGGGGLVAEAVGVRGGGIVPLLNSAQRGHLRFVSKKTF